MGEWQKPSKCTNALNCVAVFFTDEEVFIKNTNRNRDVISATRKEWGDLLEAIKAGEFDG